MCFVPVHFRFSYIAIVQFDVSNTFELSPPTETILFSKTHNIADITPNRNNFYIFYSPNDLEMHFPLTMRQCENAYRNREL